jgi:hypothetical protein
LQSSDAGVLSLQQSNIINHPILLVGVINAGLIHFRNQKHRGIQYKVVAAKR